MYVRKVDQNYNRKGPMTFFCRTNRVGASATQSMCLNANMAIRAMLFNLA